MKEDLMRSEILRICKYGKICDDIWRSLGSPHGYDDLPMMDRIIHDLVEQNLLKRTIISKEDRAYPVCFYTTE